MEHILYCCSFKSCELYEVASGIGRSLEVEGMAKRRFRLELEHDPDRNRVRLRVWERETKEEEP